MFSLGTSCQFSTVSKWFYWYNLLPVMRVPIDPNTSLYYQVDFFPILLDLICMYLTTDIVVQLFMFLLAFREYSIVKLLFKTFPSIFLLYSILFKSIYEFFINCGSEVLCQKYWLQIFFTLCRLLFMFLMLSCDRKVLLILTKSIFFNLVFYIYMCLQEVYEFSTLRSWMYSSMLYSNFIIFNI